MQDTMRMHAVGQNYGRVWVKYPTKCVIVCCKRFQPSLHNLLKETLYHVTV